MTGDITAAATLVVRSWLNDTPIGDADGHISVADNVVELVAPVEVGLLGDDIIIRLSFADLAMFVHDVQSRNAFRAGDVVCELGGYGQRFVVHEVTDEGATIVLTTRRGLTRIASRHLVHADDDRGDAS